MTTVRFNVSRMFDAVEPRDVSNSVANLGARAAELTWQNALRIAERHASWLLSPLADACGYVTDWAAETGAWTRADIAAWSDEECLALLVQNVASDLRSLGADDCELSECPGNAHEDGTEHGWYWNEAGEVLGEVCS